MSRTTSPRVDVYSIVCPFAVVWCFLFPMGFVEAQILSPIQAVFSDASLKTVHKLVVSPDGRNTYALGENILWSFQRLEDGRLVPLQGLRNGVGGVEGISEAESVSVSPDGAHVYVSARNTVTLFARDDTLGTLAFVESQVNGVNGVEGLTDARSLVISPDGSKVYVISFFGSSLVVFARDASTGSLTFTEVHYNDDAGVEGLRQADFVTTSPDGAHIYVASFQSNAVAVFARNDTSGGLTFVEAESEGLNGASSVAVSADGANVYAVSFFDGSLTVFARDTETGALTFVESQFDGNGAAASIVVSPDGTHVYTVYFNGGIAVFARDVETGTLEFVEIQLEGDGGEARLSDMVWVNLSPDGANVYTVSRIDNAVTVFARDAATGALTFVDAQLDAFGGPDGLDKAQGVTVSPDGMHVYVASRVSRFGNGAVVVFVRDSMTGILTFVEAVFQGENGITSLLGANFVVVSPDGAHVYVGSQNSLTVFERDISTGALAFVEAHVADMDGIVSLRGSEGVAVSGDGAHVFVVSRFDNALTVFERDASTGALTLIDALYDNVDGVEGLYGAYSVTVSPNGAHVYVASGAGLNADRAITLFARNVQTGELTFKEALYETHQLEAPASVTISPNGRHVYVASFYGDSLTTLVRDESTGVLTILEIHREGFGGVVGLRRAHSVVLSPDGLRVYVASKHSHAVAVFTRDVTTGSLVFVEAVFDDVDGVAGLQQAVSVAVSPDGLNVYAVSEVDGAVQVFDAAPATVEERYDCYSASLKVGLPSTPNPPPPNSGTLLIFVLLCASLFARRVA